VAGSSEAAADGQPVDAGQHHVEDDRFVGGGIRRVERLLAAPEQVDRVADALETVVDQARQPRLVLDQQDPHARRVLPHDGDDRLPL
jgi:hypothetical protein